MENPERLQGKLEIPQGKSYLPQKFKKFMSDLVDRENEREEDDGGDDAPHVCDF